MQHPSRAVNGSIGDSHECPLVETAPASPVNHKPSSSRRSQAAPSHRTVNGWAMEVCIQNACAANEGFVEKCTTLHRRREIWRGFPGVRSSRIGSVGPSESRRLEGDRMAGPLRRSSLQPTPQLSCLREQTRAGRFAELRSAPRSQGNCASNSAMAVAVVSWGSCGSPWLARGSGRSGRAAASRCSRRLRAVALPPRAPQRRACPRVCGNR